jgi:hypothetical protein
VLAIGGGLITSLAIVLAHLRRGFNFTDESYYLLGYRHPEDVHLALTSFHQVVSRLAGLGHLDVLQYRYLGLGIVVLSSALLGLAAASAWNAGARGRPPSLRTVLWAALGGMVQFSWGPRGLSYNVLNGALCNLECAFLLLHLGSRARRETSRWSLDWYALLLGGALGLHVLVKAPTAALMGVVAFAGIVKLGEGCRRAWTAVALLLLGWAAAPVWLFAHVVSPAEWWKTAQSVRAAQSFFFSPSALWLGTINTSLGALRRVGPFLLASVALILSGTKARAAGRATLGHVLDAVAVCAVLAAMVAAPTFKGMADERSRMWIPHLALVTLLAAWWLPVARRDSAAFPRRLAIVGLLARAPVLAALGSSNQLPVQVLFHLAPCLALAASLHGDAGGLGLTPRLVPVLIGPLVTLQVLAGQARDPFGIHGSIDQQTVSLPGAGGVADGIRVDAATARMVSEVRSLLAAGGFQEGDPIWSIYDNPGLVYLAGGRAPQTPWLFSGELRQLACLALERSPAGPGREFLLLTGAPEGDVGGCMRRSGRPVESFRLLGSIVHPPLPFLEHVRVLDVLVRDQAP